MIFKEYPFIHRDYEIQETWDAGIALTGAEVKSIRALHLNLTGSYIVDKNHRLSLVKCLITPFQKHQGFLESNKTRDRRLLVRKNQIFEILTKRKKGLSLIPYQIKSDGIRILVSIALVKHKNKHDKREILKKKEADREMSRILKQYV